MNLLLTFSMVYGLFMLSNWTVTWFGLTDTTIPMAPFTSQHLCQCCGATGLVLQQPTGALLLILQSCYSLRLVSLTFRLYFYSIYGDYNLICTEQLMYFWGQTAEYFSVKVIAHFSPGKQTDRWLSMFPKLSEFSCNDPLNESFLKGANSFSSWTATTYWIQHCWKLGIFWRSLMVSLS